MKLARNRTPLHTVALRRGLLAGAPEPTESACALRAEAERPSELRTAALNKGEIIGRFIRSGLARVINGKAYLPLPEAGRKR